MGLIRVFNNPVVIDLEHDDTVIEWVDGGFGEDVPVYRIEGIKYVNNMNTPYRFYAEDVEGINDEHTIAANEDGERNIPVPKRFKSYPIERMSLTLVR